MTEIYVQFNEYEGPMGFFLSYEEAFEDIVNSEKRGVCCDRCKLHLKLQTLDFEVKRGDRVYIVTDVHDCIEAVFKTPEEAVAHAKKEELSSIPDMRVIW